MSTCLASPWKASCLIMLLCVNIFKRAGALVGTFARWSPHTHALSDVLFKEGTGPLRRIPATFDSLLIPTSLCLSWYACYLLYKVVLQTNGKKAEDLSLCYYRVFWHWNGVVSWLIKWRRSAHVGSVYVGHGANLLSAEERSVEVRCSGMLLCVRGRKSVR